MDSTLVRTSECRGAAPTAPGVAGHWGSDMAQGTCSIEGCDAPTVGRGWCRRHYSRWHRTGSVDLEAPAPRACSVDGCEKPHYGHGWCSMHYTRLRRYGDIGGVHPIVGVEPHSAADEARFLAMVDQQGPLAANVPELGRCWLWLGCRTPDNYGQVRAETAHRWSYKHWIGEIPEGKELDHFACDNPPCCNPVHVRPATHLENVQRATARRTSCPHGHPYNEINTYVWNGIRRCRLCLAEQQRRYRQRKGD